MIWSILQQCGSARTSHPAVPGLILGIPQFIRCCWDLSTAAWLGESGQCKCLIVDKTRLVLISGKNWYLLQKSLFKISPQPETVEAEEEEEEDAYKGDNEESGFEDNGSATADDDDADADPDADVKNNADGDDDEAKNDADADDDSNDDVENVGSSGGGDDSGENDNDAEDAEPEGEDGQQDESKKNFGKVAKDWTYIPGIFSSNLTCSKSLWTY